MSQEIEIDPGNTILMNSGQDHLKSFTV